jgi:superfamily II DNA or RNA helicase
MAAPPEPLDLNDPRVFRGYDSRSVERGIAYAAEGRVQVEEIGPGYASGEVQGTAHFPYEVEVQWAGGVVIADDCTCPLGGDCKHAVALVVAIARASSVAKLRQESGSSRGGAEVIPLSAYRDVPRAGGSPARTPAPTSGWRESLARVAVATSSGATPLALQFTLLAPSTSRYPGYAPPAARIMVRPMRMGARGRWVKSGASWRDLDAPYLGYDLRDVDPAHTVAVRAMGGAVAGGLYSSGSDAIALERFGPGVWTALRHAVDAGVQLIGDDRSGCAVTLSPEAARIVVDLTSPTDGGIVVRAGFVHHGAPLELSPGGVGTVGSPPHGVYIAEDTSIELVALAEPVHEGLVPLLGSAPLLVPAADVDEFLEEYRPQLARVATVTSSDGSVTDEGLELEGLVTLVEHHAVDAARLRWAARYRRGDRTTTYLLWDPAGAARDRVAEKALVRELELPTDLLDRLVGPSGHAADLSVHGAQAVTLLTEVVPWLEERGQVVVEVTGDAPELRRATGDPLIELDVRDPTDADERNDWFDLSVEVSIDGEPIEFAHLFSALALDDPVLVLPSGTWLHLERPELERLRELIEEARGLSEPDRSGAVRVNRFQTSWWDELAGLGVLRSQSERWARSVARLGALSAPEHVEVPAGLKASLRPYQQHGFDWLAFLHRNELGGILADDMGLGKTVQTLALFLHVLEQRPDARFLVVAPTSVVSNWHREAAQFAPGLEVRTVTETASRRGSDLAVAVGDATVVVTSYALFRLEHDQYQDLDWEMLVLDEAQFVKNHRAKTYQCVRRLDASIKLAITGTPIENSLMDLWSMLSIVAPGLYPDPKRFSEVYRKPIESGRAPETLATLRRRVAPLMRRRTKDEVLTELPPKTEQTVDVELSPRHMRLYQAQLQRQRTKVLGLVDDVERNRFEILKSLTILRQLSLDPALIDDDHDAVGSAKLDRLVEDLTQVVAEGHRALVFSTFTRFLTRARARLDDVGLAYSYLDGRTRKRDRAISAFKDGDVPVFLISLKAGGFGLNLTEADYCFVLDPWWNPAAETQAVDRAHRIGQRNPVLVYRYVSTGTIEEKVMELKERKRALFSSVMDGDEVLSGALGADDIRALIDLPEPAARRG